MSEVSDVSVHHHAHHFANADDEFEAAKQGMWVFLVTEVLMFGGLFVAYGIFHGLYPEMFRAAGKLLSIPLGTTNTLVLITSSVTMLFGVTSTQKGKRAHAIFFMVLTVLLAACFLGIKYVEWSGHIREGAVPGAYFSYKGLPPKSQLFFSLYFLMTGLHGIHVVIGMCLISWLIKRTAKGEFGPDYYTPVELVGFYWHFVDIVWIYLFPLLYLVS